MAEEHSCKECKMRARYDAKPKSLLGRFWRWHINWCPGWRSFMDSLPEEEKSKMKMQYNLK